MRLTELRVGLSWARLARQLAKYSRAAWVVAWRPGARRPHPDAIDPQIRAWTETMRQVIADLDVLNHSTEQDFLRIGGKIGEFIQAVDAISSELTGLVDLISGGHGVSSSQALANALDCFTEMRTRYADRSGCLDGMRQEAVRFRQTLAGSQGTFLTFQMIGVLTRIEIARLGGLGADFGNLADDTRRLAGHVKAKVENALEAGELLIPPIENAMLSISALEARQVSDLSGALVSLSSFRDIQNRARDSSIRLGARSDAIAAAFKKLIVSIQFHDMTRQQVEHVIEVLRRIGLEDAGDSGAPAGTAAVLALQSSQLEDAAGKFAASVAAVASSLDDISTHIKDMAQESQTLSGPPADQGNTFFLQMEHGCLSILGHLMQLTDADAATLLTSGGLEETIGRMHGSIEEIQAIENQMHRMALNASIRASHIGAPGDALCVLAGSMQQRASESGQRSESLVKALSAMSEAVLRLAGQKGLAADGRRASHDACVSGMLAAVAELHTSGEKSIARIARIVAHGRGLREGLSETRENFSVGIVFDDAVTRARRMLQEIRETNQPGASQRDLADFTAHYTMQAELDVLARVTGSATVIMIAEPSELPASEADEFGDNVEFL